MLVMTAKVDKRKLIVAIALVAAAIGLLLVLGGNGGDDAAAASAPAADSNDQRVKFLTDFGWEVTTAPTESMQVRIPTEPDEVFTRYNALQKSQGYDLSAYAGKTVMRYVYRINNFPGATEPVYATVLVYKSQIIGGDITDTAAGGKVQGFKMNKEKSPAATTPAETKPSESAPAA